MKAARSVLVAATCLALPLAHAATAAGQAVDVEATPAAPAAAPAPSDAEADAVLAALAQGESNDRADAAAASLEEYSLNVYGFADFTYTHRLNDFAYASPYPTFMVGNVNLYAGADLGSGWHALAEFRLLYLPNGNVPASEALSAQPERVDTTVADPADYGRPQRWGGVEIERVQLDYTLHSLLTIRAGQWLTPYGIWNVDHGSPVIIGVRRPYVVGEALIPERQTGIQLFGSYLVGTTELGYNLGLSNGRGPLDAYQDLDKNKAVTARLYAVADLPIGSISLGGTLYRGRYTDRFSRFAFTATGATATEYISTARYEELGLAADLRWVWEGLTVQAEVIRRDTGYDDALRPAAFTLPGVPPGFASDFRSVGWYAMAAYRLPWWNIMPFFGGEHYDPGQELVLDSSAVWGGLNVRPTPRVVLKAQLTKSWATDDTPFVGANGILALDLQAAWSF
jgi:hypothetical protein